jgi:hypothetical protein
MHSSRSKITSKNLVRQRFAEEFNSGVKGLFAEQLLSYTLSTCSSRNVKQWHYSTSCSGIAPVSGYT